MIAEPTGLDGYDEAPVARTTMDLRRTRYLDEHVEAHIVEHFERHPWIRSIAGLVAQYWNDEATDAVHLRIVSSQLDRPDLGAHFDHVEDIDSGGDAVNHPDGVASRDPADMERGPVDAWWFQNHLLGRRWDDNGAAISLFAAFCAEHGDQDQSERDNFRPLLLWRRSDDATITREFVGVQLRPWLDGVEPLEDDD